MSINYLSGTKHVELLFQIEPFNISYSQAIFQMRHMFKAEQNALKRE